jgi:hypothetical protein
MYFHSGSGAQCLTHGGWGTKSADRSSSRGVRENVWAVLVVWVLPALPSIRGTSPFCSCGLPSGKQTVCGPGRQLWPDIRAGPWHTFCKGPRLREIKPPRIERIERIARRDGPQARFISNECFLCGTMRSMRAMRVSLRYYSPLSGAQAYKRYPMFII